MTINPRRWSATPLLILVASGKSAGLVDPRDLAKAPVIAVNDSWRLAPHADILYAADAPWWRHHGGVPEFQGERWTQDRGADGWPDEAHAMGLSVIRSAPKAGMSLNPGLIHTGGNSGYQALNLAILGGARRIALVGYDMGGPHWFGDHPGKLNRASPYDVFRKAFDEAAPQIADLGVEVINCSALTSLTCWPRAELRAIL